MEVMSSRSKDIEIILPLSMAETTVQLAQSLESVPSYVELSPTAGGCSRTSTQHSIMKSSPAQQRSPCFRLQRPIVCGKYLLLYCTLHIWVVGCLASLGPLSDWEIHATAPLLQLSPVWPTEPRSLNARAGNHIDQCDNCLEDNDGPVVDKLSVAGVDLVSPRRRQCFSAKRHSFFPLLRVPL